MIQLNSAYSFSHVPYVLNSVLDDYAEAVLLDAMPETLDAPMPIDVERFLEFYLRLQVEYKRLSYDRKILGMTAFNAGYVQIISESTGKAEPMIVQAGTVILDSSLASSKRNEPRLRFTMMHEASHWLLHQKAFSKENELFANEKFENQYLAAKEGRIDYSRNQSERTDSERIERQADFLSSALLMPRPPLRMVYRSFFAMLKEQPRALVHRQDDAYIHLLIAHVAQTFGVSKRAALIRLEKLTAIVDRPSWGYRHS